MRAVVTKGGIPTFVSKEEYNLLSTITETVYKEDLTERQAEMAKQLVHRGVLQRYSDAERGIYFKPNVNKGI